MFDTHCHLNFDVFDTNLNSVVQTARDVGIKNIVIPGTDFKSSQKARDIAEDYDGFYFAAGIHPTEKLDDSDIPNMAFKLEELIKSSLKAVAIGECGLDYYHPQSSKRLQIELLKMHMSLAKKTGMSLILHNRHATADMLATLDDNWSDTLSGRSVLHCASPEKEILDYAQRHNIFLGFDGDITYDKTKQEFLSDVPLELLVTETDAPFLTPEPIRSEKRFPNDPQNIRFVLEKIAEIKKISVEEVSKITSNNAKRLFNL